MNRMVAQLRAERARAVAQLDALRPAIEGAAHHLRDLENARYHAQELVSAIDGMLEEYDEEEFSSTDAVGGGGPRNVVEGA